MNNQQSLLNWYQLNKRDLPWRNTQNPYLIWLSEIILQQTRVNQGLPYFLKFAQKFPQIESLAAAPEDEVLKLWQGLGYYSRGRNMLKTAQIIVLSNGGKFPDNYHDLLKLKGIGPYTAAAIASFAYNQAVAVLDGNVFRVLSRFYLISEPIQSSFAKKLFNQLANEFLNKDNPALHNQAMMELGALICTPLKPACLECPLQQNCLAFIQNSQLQFPIKLAKAKPKNRFIAYFHFQFNSQIAVFRRPSGGIWEGLYDLPYLESEEKTDANSWFEKGSKKKWYSSNQIIDLVFEKKHILTHQHIYAQFYRINCINKPILNFDESWVEYNQLPKLGVSKLLSSYLELAMAEPK
jgi:A/G-specific adenine glycosylase